MHEAGLSRRTESPVLWHKKMVNWSILTSNVYCLATGEADQNNKLMSTSLDLLCMCNNYSVVPYSTIPCSGFYRVPPHQWRIQRGA